MNRRGVVQYAPTSRAFAAWRSCKKIVGAGSQTRPYNLSVNFLAASDASNTTKISAALRLCGFSYRTSLL